MWNLKILNNICDLVVSIGGHKLNILQALSDLIFTPILYSPPIFRRWGSEWPSNMAYITELKEFKSRTISKAPVFNYDTIL